MSWSFRLQINESAVLKLAKDPSTPIEIQRQLSQINGWDTWGIRQHIANNTSDLDLLLKLAGDTSVNVQRVAREQLKKLYSSNS